MLTSFDVGRTFRTPGLKLGVSCIAAISKENVIWTEGCIVAAGCSLAAVAVSIDTVWAGPSKRQAMWRRALRGQPRMSGTALSRAQEEPYTLWSVRSPDRSRQFLR